MQTHAIFPEEVALMARDAYSKGLAHLMNHVLPSAFDVQGAGWQELWEDAEYAGVYASCDGLLLLARAPEYGVSRESVQQLWNKVYRKHLVPIFRDPEPTTVEEQDETRRQAHSVTMKLAKFIQVSCEGASGGWGYEEELMRSVWKKMLCVGQVRNSLWKAVSPLAFSRELTARISATSEALLAYHRAGRVRSRSYHAMITALTSVISDSEEGTQAQRILALWALSEVSASLDQPLQAWLGQQVLEFLTTVERSKEPIKTFFRVPSKSGQDYFSYNEELVLLTAALNLTRLTPLGQPLMRELLPFIEPIAAQLIANGFYKRSPHSMLYFWEFFYAMRLMDRFALHHTTSLFPSQQRGLMYVTPLVFQAKRITLESDLCVVLMPFTTEWSSDVFQVYSDAVNSHGMRVWRSDLNFSDDAVMQTIWEYINKAGFIIADCTGRNPNVFYELGIAHCLGKRVFITAQSRDDVPFDISHIRSTVYNTRPSGIEALKDMVGKFIATL
jgi:hypothetical protein